MPRLARFASAEIAMYFADHPPPHFHVLGRDGAAQVDIESLEVIAYSGRIDLRDGQCTLASAGHESPLLLPADGPVQTIDFETGPPLGFEVSSRFPMWRGKLEPGASLIAYTDGITEAFNADDQAYGSDRLLAALRTGYSAQDNCRRLIAEVHRFAGAAPQSDDITVLAIRLSRQTETPETGLATMPETKQSTEERAHADTSDRPG
jgi:sigma-B regulation protein RsbU (phosphoserine phosphatase)